MLNEIIKDFQKAIKKLEEVLKIEKTEMFKNLSEKLSSSSI
ncbi:MAG: hypothetical protein Q7S60_04960 [bacterium]|nr:hypothetical protein [bacterium]